MAKNIEQMNHCSFLFIKNSCLILERNISPNKKNENAEKNISILKGKFILNLDVNTDIV